MLSRTVFAYKALLIACMVMLAGILTGCEPDEEPDDEKVYPDTSCVNCHMDKDLLKEVADPIEQTEDSGEG